MNKYVKKLAEEIGEWPLLVSAAMNEVQKDNHQTEGTIQVEAAAYHALCLMALIGIHQIEVELLREKAT
jgi:hypothetical protein